MAASSFCRLAFSCSSSEMRSKSCAIDDGSWREPGEVDSSWSFKLGIFSGYLRGGEGFDLLLKRLEGRSGWQYGPVARDRNHNRAAAHIYGLLQMRIGKPPNFGAHFVDARFSGND